MARSVATIQAQLLSFFAANNNLTYQDEKNIQRNITYNTSKRAFWNLLAFVVAAIIAMLEQMLDLLSDNIQTQVAQSAAVSALWIQQMMFRFQYDANHPQVLQLSSNLVPSYPVVRPALQIISACSVTVDQSNTVNIKVATGNPLQQLDALQLQAAQSYINLSGYAGINYNVSSQPPDRIYIAADIYHTKQYTDPAVIASVVSAIQLYLQDISLNNFDGVLKVSDLEGCIRNVNGITDVVLNNVSCRLGTPVAYSSTTAYNPGNLVLYTDGYVYKNISAISSAGEAWNPAHWSFVNTPFYVGFTPLVASSKVVNNQYQPVAGYIIPENAGPLSGGATYFLGQHFNVDDLAEAVVFFGVPPVYRCKVANSDIGFKSDHWNYLGPAHGDTSLALNLIPFAQ